MSVQNNTKLTNENTVWHEPTVFRADREQLNGHRAAILWFTGLSGAGKSTLAHAVEDFLHSKGVRTFVLDGDNIRRGLCKDLGFSEEDRNENIRRIGEVSKLLMDAGLIVMTAFISPYRKDRQIARELVSDGDFIEIYCNARLDVCESRDVKGLYRKARSGEIPEFTGITSPYEAPDEPEIELQTGERSIEECVEDVIAHLRTAGVVELR
jgi:adenylylsulfate kinase